MADWGASDSGGWGDGKESSNIDGKKSSSWGDTKGSDERGGAKGSDDWGSTKDSDNWGSTKGSDNWGSTKGSDNWGKNKGSDNWNGSKGADNWGKSKGSDDWGSSKGADNWSKGKGSDDWGSSKGSDNWGGHRGSNDWNSGGQNDQSNKRPRRDDTDWKNKRPRGDNDWSDKKPSGDADGNDWGGNKRKPRGDSDWSDKKPNGDADGDDWNSNKPSGQDAEGQRPQSFKPEQLDLEEEAKLLSEGAALDFKHYDEQKVTCIPTGVIGPVETFEDIVTSKLLLENIKAQKYTRLTPIQKWAMPAIMEDFDLIGCAQTGSGKTAAFLTPVLQTLLNTELEPNDPNSDCQNPYCLILSPTRELANQIYIHATMLSKDSILKCHFMYGQVQTAHIRSKLLTGCHVLVSTPGRLKDFVQRGWLGFKNIKYVILDEGDRLVDEGFTEDIRFFFNHPTMPPKEKRQTLFFSATFKQSTQLSAREYLKDNFIFLTVGRIGAANADIRQEFLRVSRSEKKRELKKILSAVSEDEKTIVFTQTKMAADMLAGFFTALNLSSTSIHGDRLQYQREQAIKAFKKGEKRFLISSPVGNRGLDLPKVALVINYDLPNNIDEYVHRIGRTGRAGHTGRAISFYDEERDREILPDLLEVLKEVKQDIPDWMLSESSGPQTEEGANEEWGGAPSSTTNPTQGSNEQDKPSCDDNTEWGTTPNNSNANASELKADDGWGPTDPNNGW